MILHANEPGMVRNFHNLRQHPIRRHARKPQPRRLQPVAIGDIDLIAVAMPLRHHRHIAINPPHQRILGQSRRVLPQPHGAAQIGIGIALFQLIAARPLGQQPHHRLGTGAEFRGGGASNAQQIARSLNHRHLHAKANAKEGYLALTGKAHRLNLALSAAFTKATGHQNTMHALQPAHSILAVLKNRAIHPIELHPGVIGNPAMRQRLIEALIGIEQAGVFAHHRNGHLALRGGDALDNILPARDIRLTINAEVEVPQHLPVQPLIVIGQRHLINAARIKRRYHTFGPHIAEQCNLAALILRNRPVATAEQDLRLDAHAEQFLHRMLGRLGLQLTSRGDIGHQRQMQKQAARRAQLIGQLPYGFKKGQALNIAHRAADFDEDEIIGLSIGLNRFLDGIGDMRNDLDGGAEIIPPPLLGDHLGIEPPRGPVIGLIGRNTGEALIMPEVEISLRPVIGDENLAMLIGRHRARIDIEIGVQLAQPHPIAASLQQRPERRRRDALAKRRDHATGDEYEPCHGSPS